jgi:hypothetical protein
VLGAVPPGSVVPVAGRALRRLARPSGGVRTPKPSPPPPPAPQDKHRVYADRLQLLQQRIRRNPMFRGRTLLAAQADDSPSVQLTELSALKGAGCEPKIVMGCISRLEDGRWGGAGAPWAGRMRVVGWWWRAGTHVPGRRHPGAGAHQLRAWASGVGPGGAGACRGPAG